MSRFEMDASVMRKLMDARDRAVRDAGEHLLEEANRTVPFEEGHLQRSGQASAKGDRAVVSYDTPYAVRQHEDTRLRHKNKGRAKWAERTFNEESQRVGQRIADDIRKAL